MKSYESGFTLIELLVVLAIIGILAAIALPQFAEYRSRGFDSRAINDLRDASTAQEARFIDQQAYVTCSDVASCEDNLPGLVVTDGVTISMRNEGDHFTGETEHSSGTRAFNWDSSAGGLQQ